MIVILLMLLFQILTVPYEENIWSFWEYTQFGFMAFLLLTYVVNILRYGLNYFWTHGNFIYHYLTALIIFLLLTDFLADNAVVDYIERSQRYGIDTIYSTSLVTDLYFETLTRIFCCLVIMFCVLLVFKSFLFNGIILRCYYTFKLLRGKIFCLVMLSYILIHVETGCVWFELIPHPNLSMKLPSTLINTFTGQQVVSNATDTSNHMTLILYALFCGTILCFSCVIIVHHYGIAKYYTRDIFYFGSLHKSCCKTINLLCKNLKEQCLQRHTRLRGGCNTKTMYQNSTAEQNKFENKIKYRYLQTQAKNYTIEKMKRKHYIITKDINKQLNDILNKLNQPDFVV